MGSSSIALIVGLALLSLSRITARAIAQVLCERARRATLVAFLDAARHNVGELRVHHDSSSCDLHLRRHGGTDDDSGSTGVPRRCG